MRHKKDKATVLSSRSKQILEDMNRNTGLYTRCSNTPLKTMNSDWSNGKISTRIDTQVHNRLYEESNERRLKMTLLKHKYNAQHKYRTSQSIGDWSSVSLSRSRSRIKTGRKSTININTNNISPSSKFEHLHTSKNQDSKLKVSNLKRAGNKSTRELTRK